MTETDWLGCNPKPMLGFLRGNASDRKLRLFAGACCCRVSHLVVDSQLYPQNRQECYDALDVVERFADGLATDEELRAAFNAAFGKGVGPGSPIPWEADYNATTAIGWSTVIDAFDAAENARKYAVAAAIEGTVADSVRCTETGEEVWSESALVVHRAEQSLQCDLLREIFGNPFRHAAIEGQFRTATVVKLAQAIYETRAFDTLPILADALEEAGCTNAEILQHCRAAKEHVRGCWVVDLILGKH